MPGVKTGVYTAVHEDFEGASNAVMASAVVLHQPVKAIETTGEHRDG
jgi:hypothetical protein